MTIVGFKKLNIDLLVMADFWKCTGLDIEQRSNRLMITRNPKTLNPKNLRLIEVFHFYITFGMNEAALRAGRTQTNSDKDAIGSA